MDTKHKLILEKHKNDLACAIDYDNVFDLLKKAKILSSKQLENIEKAESKFCRKIKLIEHLQEAKSISAFDEFIRILEVSGELEALKILSPDSLKKKQVTSGTKLIYSMADKLANKKEKPNYPLGLQPAQINDDQVDKLSSNQNSSSILAHHNLSSISSIGSYALHNSDIESSPLKEKHQATLIRANISESSSKFGEDSSNMQANTSGHSTMGNKLGSNNRRPHLTSQYYEMSSSPNRYLWGNRMKEQISGRYSQGSSGNLGDISLKELNISDHNDRKSSDNCVGKDADDDDDDDDEPLVCWHPATINQESSHFSGHCCLPSPVASDSESSTNSDIPFTEMISEMSVIALAQEGPSTMKVKMATTCHQDPIDDYKMSALPRGPCLIINNIDFESEVFPQRKGSDQDARRFDDIFQQLGFVVILRRNQTADQMKNLCKEIASQCKKEHDALFVVLLSHGSESGIYGADGIEVDLNDIITYFDNKNCKAMIGKPKVFVIQACRGRMIDYGERDSIDADSVSPSMTNPSDNWTAALDNQVPFSRRSEFARGKRGNHHPIRTDMLLIFSCLAGYVSVRNELAGSWLGVALTYFIMTSAHEKDLCRILNMVSADIRERVSSDGHTQCLEVTQLGWTKNLYFNPGVFL